MKIRHLPYSLALGLSACFVVAAQTPDQPATAPAAPHANHATKQPNPAHEAHSLAKKLGLSRDQVSQLQPILADRDQQRQAVRADTSIAPKDRHAKMMNLRQDFDAKIKAVLTDDQKQKYDQMQQERMQQHRQQSKQS